jgi:hypothetical protein
MKCNTVVLSILLLLLSFSHYYQQQDKTSSAHLHISTHPTKQGTFELRPGFSRTWRSSTSVDCFEKGKFSEGGKAGFIERIWNWSGGLESGVGKWARDGWLTWLYWMNEWC